MVEFEDLSRRERSSRLSKRLSRLEWHNREGSLGNVAFQLRQRARRFSTQSIWVLAALLAVVAAGLALYIVRPILQDVDVIQARVHTESVRQKQLDLVELDLRRRKLRDEAVVRTRQVWVPVKSGTEAALYDVQIASDDRTVIAVGSEGTILDSEDGGVTWAVRESGTEVSLYEVQVASDNSTVIAVGDEGTILHSEDGGETWVVRKNDTEAVFFDVRIASDGQTVIAVGDKGTILHSEDGGETWTVRESGTWAALFEARIASDSQAVIVVGSGGTILRSEDNGETWAIRESGIETALQDIQFSSDDRTIIAVGSEGTILHSEDGGETWAVRESGTEAILYEVRIAPDDRTVVAVGDEGVILHSEDGGETWAIRESGTEAVLYEVEFASNGQTAIAMGDEGVILHSEDGGETWTVRESGTERALLGLGVASDDQTMVAVGGSGTILSVTNRFSRDIAQAESDNDLLDALEALPKYESNQVELSLLSAIKAERRRIIKDLDEASKNLKAAQGGSLSRSQRLEEFQTFLDQCVGDALQKTPTETSIKRLTACSDAYANVISEEEGRKWWELIAQNLPPGVLLLFLLATLGGLYRYNVRMAGFYHARADAMELLVEGQSAETFDALTQTLAAERVEFRSGKTPVDQVTEITKSVIGRVKTKE